MLRQWLIPAVITSFVFATAAAAAEVPAEPAVDIISAEFGTFDASNADELVFEPGAVVPHRAGQRYGWVIELRTKKRSLSVSEEYLLPAAKPRPATDPLSESLNIATPPRHQVSQRQLVPVDGKIYGEWSVGPGEPAGHRRLQVIVEGKTAASFEYDVK